MLRAMALDKFDNAAFISAGEYVSIAAPMDRRSKCVRTKSANKHPRNNKQNWKGERTPAQLAVSSFIATELAEAASTSGNGSIGSDCNSRRQWDTSSAHFSCRTGNISIDVIQFLVDQNPVSVRH